MTHRLTIAALAGALVLAAGCASTKPVHEGPGEAAFRVIEEDARIFPASSINGFEVVDRDTLLLRAGVNRLYLADTWRTCGRDLRFEFDIAIDHRGDSGVDSFADAIIDGRRCPLDNVRRVERIDAPADAPAQ